MVSVILVYKLNILKISNVVLKFKILFYLQFLWINLYFFYDRYETFTFVLLLTQNPIKSYRNMRKTNITKNETLVFSIVSGILLFTPFVVTSNIQSERNIFEMPFFWKMMMEYLLLIGFFFLNYLVLIPKLYFKKKYIVYGLMLLGCFMLYTKIPELIIEIIPLETPNTRIGSRRMRRNPFYFMWIVKILTFLCASFVALFLRNNKRFREMKEEKQMAEIAYLRSQINPHFLFNTLNNIYALTLQKSDNAPDAVMKLSKMMRFMVTESSKDTIPLPHDIDYIKSYIQLQQMRLADRNAVQLKIEGITGNLKIAPLLLINYIENAFKYGVMDEVEHSIQIAITIKDEDLHLHVRNKISDHQLREDEKSLTGLTNAKKRLDYLYDNKYTLDIKNDETYYTVNLKMKLND